MPNDMSPILEERVFSLTNFLEGKTHAWGIFEDRFEKVKLRFCVEMSGSWSGDIFILLEHFCYDDGREEKREWRVKPGENDQFTATCDDCIGEAVGRVVENEIQMRYRFRLKLKKRLLDVDFYDRIIKLDEHRAVNRAAMSKFGIKLGELSLFFEKDTARS